MIRNILLKLLVIFGVIFLVIFLVPNFASYKSTNKKVNTDMKNIAVEEKKSKDTNESLSPSLDTLKTASLMFFKDNNIPKKKGGKKTVLLNTLYKKKLTNTIKINNIKCDSKKSYAKITKLDDDYELKVYLKCGSLSDYKLSHVGKYSYCTSTLCDNDPVKDIISDTPSSNDNKEEKSDDNKINNDNNGNNAPSVNNSPNAKTIPAWSSWSEYRQTSCNTTNVKCDNNDLNCRKEIEVKKESRYSQMVNKNFTVYPISLNYNHTSYENLCSSYNYFNIDGVLYKTNGNYDEIMSLNGYSTNNWTYLGRSYYSDIQGYNGYYYFKFIGMENDKYIYDAYKFNFMVSRASDSYCRNSVKEVKYYTTSKNPYTYTKSVPEYRDVCFYRERVR